MSELDIELQKQTANVSLTEIMQELDNVKTSLRDNTQEEQRNDRE